MTKSIHRYGQAAKPPAGRENELEPGYIPASVIWAYLAIAGTFTCPPLGLLAGIYSLTRKPGTRRARLLAKTAVIFGAFSVLTPVVYIITVLVGE